jgi:hypothetical protein
MQGQKEPTGLQIIGVLLAAAALIVFVTILAALCHNLYVWMTI